MDAGAQRFQLGPCVVQPLLSAGDQANGTAAGRELLGSGTANAGAASGDNDDICHVWFHWWCLCHLMRPSRLATARTPL